MNLRYFANEPKIPARRTPILSRGDAYTGVGPHLMVLTAIGSYVYRREDGVYVVPIGTLKD